MNFQNGFNGGFNPAFGGGFGGNGYGMNGGGGGYGSPHRGRGRRDDRGGRGRGRGGGQHGRDNRPSAPESSNARMRRMVIKFADEEDFHPVEDPPRLAKVLRRQWREGYHGVLDGFRIGVTQEPHKHAHYVSLLCAISHRQSPSENGKGSESPEAQVGQKRKAESGPDEVDCSGEILEDLSKAFKGWVQGREWLNMRLCLQFFSLLVSTGLISSVSLLELYRSLLSVLDEVGGGGVRAERVVRAVGEGLMRSGHTLYPAFPDQVEAIIASIENSINSRTSGKTLSSPFWQILPEGEEAESYHDTLDHLVNALRSVQAENYAAPSCLPVHHIDTPEGCQIPEPFELSIVSLPPELFDIDEDRWQVGEGQVGNIRIFADDVVLPPDTPAGWTLRSLVLDMTHIFEINRKDAARLLLDLPRYLSPNLFKSHSAATASTDPEIPSPTLSYESLVISTILNALALLPAPPNKEVYYGSVIAEMCKLSPNTVAPPVGRSVRKLYSMLGTEGLDVEISRRLAEWFAVHLSNFGFQWMWKEWIPDVELPSAHPKKAFMRRVVEMEVRLSYHDRILSTLPDAMTSESGGIIPSVAPDAFWPYEKDDHPLHSEAVELLKLCRSRAPVDQIRSHLSTLPNASSGPGEPLSSDIRLMACETLLQLGSRSFSHFLNATERYGEILRFLTPDPASRRTLLQAVYKVWVNSSQMRLIVIDKYLQYGILEASDVVSWSFEDEESLGGRDTADGWTDGWKWEVLRMCLDKLVGRVASFRKRVKNAEREDEAARARRAAEKLEKGGDVGEGATGIDAADIEGELPLDERQDSSKESRNAQTSLDIHTTNLEKVLLITLKQFAASLLPWTSSESRTSLSDEGLKSLLELVEKEEEGWWAVRARLGWYKEFIRLYQHHLTSLVGVIDKDWSGWKGESTEGRAEGVVLGLWRAAVGGEE